MSNPTPEDEWETWIENNTRPMPFIGGLVYGFIIGVLMMGGLWYVSV